MKHTIYILHFLGTATTLIAILFAESYSILNPIVATCIAVIFTFSLERIFNAVINKPDPKISTCENKNLLPGEKYEKPISNEELEQITIIARDGRGALAAHITLSTDKGFGGCIEAEKLKAIKEMIDAVLPNAILCGERLEAACLQHKQAIEEAFALFKNYTPDPSAAPREPETPSSESL